MTTQGEDAKKCSLSLSLITRPWLYFGSAAVLARAVFARESVKPLLSFPSLLFSSQFHFLLLVDSTAETFTFFTELYSFPRTLIYFPSSRTVHTDYKPLQRQTEPCTILDTRKSYYLFHELALNSPFIRTSQQSCIQPSKELRRTT